MADSGAEDGGVAAEGGAAVEGDETVAGGTATAPAEDRTAASVGVVVGAAVLGGGALPGPAGWRPVAIALGVATVLALGLTYSDAVDRFEGVLVALAVAAVALPGPAAWQPVVAGLGVATALAFGLGHLGTLDRLPAAVLAAGTSLAVTGYGFARLVLSSTTGATPGSGPWVAAGVGLLGVSFAYADAVAVPRRGLVSRLAKTLLGGAVGAAGIFASAVWIQVLAVPVVLLPGSPGGVVTTVLSVVAAGLGLGSVGLLYLLMTDRTLSYVDFEVPDKWDVVYTVGGVLALLGSLIALSILFTMLGTPTSEHSVVREAEQNPTILLALVPASWLLIGPSEELLFRNVIQKSLYDTFSRTGAVLAGSVVFALAHLPAYFNPYFPAMLQPLSIVFLLSIILGVLYERTGNTTVPALVHGTFDAVLFGLLYLSLRAGGDGAAAVLALVP